MTRFRDDDEALGLTRGQGRRRRSADGKTKVDVICRKCSRRWIRLEEGGTRLRVSCVTAEFVQGKIRYWSPWTGRTTNLRPAVSVTGHAGMVVGETKIGKLPIYADKRYRVTCHPRCGRSDVPITQETLESAFAEAVRQGHADTPL